MTASARHTSTQQGVLPIFQRARAHEVRLAVVAPEGRFSYADLLARSESAALQLLQGRADLAGERVAFMAPAGVDYIEAQWGIWRAGGVAVPLKLTNPPPQLEYALDDSGAKTAIAHPQFGAVLRPIAESRNMRFLRTEDLVLPRRGGFQTRPYGPLPNISPDRPAMVLYTSGTTNRPKGVLSTHENIQAQVESLVKAWGWRSDDRIPLFLPLDHIHGIVNILSCALWSGATVEMIPVFDAAKVWDRIASGELTLFMAVPDIYTRLIDAWDRADPEMQAKMRAGCEKLRLMVSGSSALPVPRLERWRQISGHTLLERYGMTEIGMALSNPLHGDRRPGYVGTPLPGVEVRLVDELARQAGQGRPGEIQVRGPNVFKEYLGRPEATAASFTPDGWFRTGDVAVIEDGYYRILGRMSTDIIKSGGEKVSALEIEPVLLRHPAVADCAVVGVADARWGEAVTAVVVLKAGASLSLSDLREFARQHLAAPSVPTRLELVEKLPRNAMGKVVKPDLRRLIEERARP